MRGREELVLRVYVDHRAPSHVTLMPLELFSEYGKRAGWEQTSLGDKDLKKEKMIFLMTGYAKYRCPYVWVGLHPIQTLHSHSSVTIPSRTTATLQSSRQSTSAHQDRRVENKR